MDQIEECFTKFFFTQTPEIEPSTIQCLIDHGYYSKMSLIAMDLVLDLPEIKEVNLAQRSILRKYLAALQERSPFFLNIDETSYNYINHNNGNNNTRKEQQVSKKRKFEVFQEDTEESEEEEEQSPIVSPPRRQTRPKSITPTSNSPLVHTRLSFEANNQASVSSAESELIEMDQQIDETMVQMPKSRRSVSRISKKKEVVRTPSQIRYQELKKERESLVLNNQLDQSITVAGSRRSSIGRTPHVTKSSVKSRQQERQIQQNSPVQEPVKIEKEKHVPTAAELAIRAKIEKKKQESGDKQKRRGTNRSRK